MFLYSLKMIYKIVQKFYIIGVIYYYIFMFFFNLKENNVFFYFYFYFVFQLILIPMTRKMNSCPVRYLYIFLYFFYFRFQFSLLCQGIGWCPSNESRLYTISCNHMYETLSNFPCVNTLFILSQFLEFLPFSPLSLQLYGILFEIAWRRSLLKEQKTIFVCILVIIFFLRNT